MASSVSDGITGLAGRAKRSHDLRGAPIQHRGAVTASTCSGARAVDLSINAPIDQISSTQLRRNREHQDPDGCGYIANG